MVLIGSQVKIPIVWLLIIAEALNGLTNARQHVRLVAHELLKLGTSLIVLVLRIKFVIEKAKGDGLHLRPSSVNFL